MSSNIGAEAEMAYQKYLDAESIDEKIKNLEYFLAIVPKHKKTEKMVALNRSRLAKLKREQEEQRIRAKSIRAVSPFSIKKEGIQIIFVSVLATPGVGKTSLLNYLTGAAAEKIGKFTPLPEIGVFRYKRIRFQMVDMPSIPEGAATGTGSGKEILAQLRSCDLLCVCVDLSKNIKEQMGILLKEFVDAEIKINKDPPPIDIQKTGANKIQIFYLTTDIEDSLDLSEKIREVLEENGLKHAIVKIFGRITIGEVVDALIPSITYKKAILIGTKGDLPHTSENFDELKKLYSETFPIVLGVSVKKNVFPDDFGESILKILKKIRVYTMNNGIVAEKPLILNQSATIRDVALKIHKSFLELFEHAIVIRESERQKRKKVGLDYEVIDGDIVEIHIR